jgi:glyoxylase-like metal-dependent hydrolase (beta-lactamase superfamily II)
MIKISQFGPITRFDLARTIAGRGRYWSSAYLVDGLLVDSGPAYAARELLDALDGINLACMLNTHTHEDHIGGNLHLQRRQADLKILAHPLALPVLTDPRGKQPLHLYRRIYWGWPGPCRAQEVAEGQQIETEHACFKVIYTPGHTPDHICLYESKQGWLFTGDLYVGGQDRAIRAGSQIWEIIRSLKRLAALPAERLFPGCARVRDHPAEVLANKIAYLEELGERILDLHHRGWDIRAIMRQVCGGPMLIEFITLGHFSRRQLVLSYLDIKDQVEPTGIAHQVKK